MKDVIKKAEEYASKEISLYNSPKIEHFRLSNKVGQKLAEKLNVDKDIVMLGTILMDLKLGECIKEGKVGEHIKRSSDASKEFLKQFNLNAEVFNKIINCIEAHHGENYQCKEAEVCANADCYRFLHPRGIFSGVVLFSSRGSDVDKILSQVEAKSEEKHKILSLDICKKELEPYYKKFMKLIEKAKK